MSEAGLRLLDRGLPRLEMHSAEFLARKRAAAQPACLPTGRASTDKDSKAMMAEARGLLAAARADREQAAAMLASARAEAGTILAGAREAAAAGLAAVASCGEPRKRPAEIIREIADRHGFSVDALLGPGVARHLTVARHEAMAMVHATWPELSMPALGRALPPRSLDDSLRAAQVQGEGLMLDGGTRPLIVDSYGQGDGATVDGPLHTDTTKDRFGLVTVEIDGQTYAIADIGMRMLTPRERFRAQGFPDSYIIDRRPDGSPITATVQGSCCGNSVCPPLAAALVEANCGHLAEFREAAE